MAASPQVSVIVCSFNRNDFLDRALESVFDQTLDRRLYEVIVVRNQPSKIMRSKINFKVDCDLTLDGEPLGEWIITALDHTQGDIIAFLDDDDLFLRDRLKTVVDVFSSNSSCLYYHTSQLKLKCNETEGAGNTGALGGGKMKFYGNNKQAEMWNLWRYGASFNLSSIAVRKSIFTGIEEYVKRTNTGVIQLLFFKAISSQGELCVETTPRVIYRIHEGNRSPNDADDFLTILKKMSLQTPVMLRDIAEIRKFLREHLPSINITPLESLEAKYDMYKLLTDPGSSRAELIRFFLYNVAARRARLWDMKTALIAIYLLFPGTMRKALFRKKES